MITANRKLLALIISVVLIGNTFLFLPNVSAGLTPVKIMPLGDSITEGYYYPGSNDSYYEGYRRNLGIYLNNSGLDVDFVGSQSDGSGFDSDHEGHSGITTDQIRDNVYSLLDSNPADIVLLHVGTNDIQLGQEVTSIVSEINSTLNEIDIWETDNQNVTVVIAKIILRSDDQNWNLTTVAYNQALETLVLSRIGNGDRLVLVDMASALTYPSDIGDDHIHPTENGYDAMARVWFNALRDILNVYSLAINSNGNGQVSREPTEVDYSYGTAVNLIAEAQSGWEFTSWSGDVVSSSNPVSLVIDDNKTVTATFTRIQCKLTIITNLGTTTPSVGEHWYPYGSVITVESIAPSAETGVRYVSSGWTGVGSVPASGEATTLTFTISAPSSITWSWITQYYLTVSSTYGVTGGAGWYNSGTSAYATINPTTVSGSGGTQYTFSSWGGDASGSSSTSNPIVMNSPKAATATWSPVTSPTPTPTSNPTSNPSATATPKPSTVLPTGTPSPTSTPSPASTVPPSPSTTIEPTTKPQDNGDNLALYSIVGISVVLIAIFVIVLWLKKFRT